MKTYQINRMIVVAAIACLPVACGTNSPMGPDAAANTTLTALRVEPLPPTVPEMPLPPSGEASPSPIPETDPLPSPKPVPPSTTEPGSVPAPADRGGRRPAPQPEPTTDPNEPSVDGPAGDVPAPPQPSPGPSPEPTTGGPAGGITPPPAGETVGCVAASIEILPLSTFLGTSGMAFEATLRDKDGVEITDDSCETVLWEAEGTSAGSRLVITYGATSRNVTISGMMAGSYKIGATTPNGQAASIVIDVQ